MIQPYVCLIEDDAIMGESIVERFRLEGIRADWFSKGYEAREAIHANAYGVVISDVRLPDLDGDELYLQLVAQGGTLPPFILMTAYATVERAVDLLKLGVKDYVTKPFDIATLIQTVRDVVPAQASPESDTELGVSQAAQNLRRMVPRLAGRASAVLLVGESGVGKEVLARLIHSQAGPDLTARPFVAVNCGAIASTIAEAEFFGYEKGLIPVRTSYARVTSNKPTAARCSWMKSESYRRRCKARCCVRYRKSVSADWAPNTTPTPSSTWSAPPTETWPRWSAPSCSGKTFTTGSTPSPLR